MRRVTPAPALSLGVPLLVAGVVALAVAGILATTDLGGSVARQVRQVIPTPGGSPPDRPGRWFSWTEFERSTAASSLGLDNAITPEGRRRIRLLVAHVLDPLRESLGRPVRVTSGWRTAAVNRAIGGAAGSQHMRGEAADIKVTGMTAAALAAAILRLGLPVDQLIWYADERGGHVHVSWAASGVQRGQVLHAPAAGGYVARRPPGA